MLVACFCHIMKIKWSIIGRTVIKDDWLAGSCCKVLTKNGWRCISKLPMLVDVASAKSPDNENQGPVPEEIYQTLLTIIKSGNELGQDLSIQVHNSPCIL